MATDLKKVWMVGDSWVHWLMQYCKELGIAKDLGLQDIAVSWFGQRGMQWGDVFVRLHNLESHKHPQVIVIHCGGNDLGKLRGVALIRRMKEDLKHFAGMFPHTTFVLSTIAQRQKWLRRAQSGYKLDKARRNVNKVMSAYSRDMGMLVIGHTNIDHQDQTAFRKDGVHLTPKGNTLFLGNICDVLKQI